MNYWKFLFYTLLGSLPWTFALAWIGMQLGDKIDKATQLSTVFHGLDVVILVLFVTAVALYIYRHIKRDRAAEAQAQAQSTFDPRDVQRMRR
jgi:membrane protein DedA with SNARE-associated domain